MILTERDIHIIRDIGLSHVMSRDQIMELYFGSVTRTNTRLRELSAIGMVRKLETPFFLQSLYMAGRTASEVVGEKIGPLLERRTSSPRFIQHALSVTNVRLALLKRGAVGWRFEQQLWSTLSSGHEVRPDGLVSLKGVPTFIEVDLGHVTPSKFAAKLRAYELLMSGEVARLYGFETFRLLTVTTGPKRAATLSRLRSSSVEHAVETFEILGIARVGAWS